MVQITERAIFSLIVIPIIFGLITFDFTMSSIFFALAVFGYLMFLGDRNVTYHFESNSSQRYADIAIGIGAVFLFYVIAPILVKILSPIFGFPVSAETSIQSLYAGGMLFSSYILAGAPFLIFLFWGIIIPLAETIFIVRTYEGLLDIFNKAHEGFPSLIVWLAFLIVSTGMAIFHIQSKGAIASSSPALLVTLLFFAFSFIILIWRRQSLPLAVMHITANIIGIRELVPALAISNQVLVLVGVGLLIYGLQTNFIQNILSRV